MIKLEVSPDELSTLCLGLTLVGMTREMGVAANEENMTEEEIAQYEVEDRALMDFYNRLSDLRDLHDEMAEEDN